MPEIQAPRIQNRRQDDITKELISDYKNFEKYDWYNKETAELWKTHLNKMRQRLNNSRAEIINYKDLSKNFPDKFKEFTASYNKYEKEIIDYTKKLGNSEYMRHHKETLNKLWSIIDNYENEVIELIKSLVDDIWDMEVITKEKWNVEAANTKVKYVEIWEDWIYTLTKATNRPKIHQVLSGILSPWEVRKIEYSWCTNNSIKTKMLNAISNSEYENTQQTTSCFLQYDSTKKTYVLSDWNWNILTQRALIREWVKLTPPSKIKKEARITKKEGEKARIEKINNINLSKQEQQDLIDSMQEKLRKSLKKEDRDAFFQITESSINEAIKQAKLEWYELQQNNPVWKRGWSKYYVTLNLINAWSKAEIERPFIEKEKLKKYWIKDNSKFKNYISQRVSAKRNSFDYLTKKWSTINENDYWVWNELKENEKEFAIKWLQMLWNRADAVLNKIWNTKIKDDDIEFTALKTYTRDVINDIETWKFTDKNMENIKNKITSMLKKFFKHNRFRSSMQINEKEIKTYINNILSSQNKEAQIIAMRKLWASRTWFDNSQTAFLRDEIFEEYWKTPKKDEYWNIMKDEEWNIIYEEWIIDLKDDNYEKYFERINELYSVNPETDIWEDNEVKEPKKSHIDELYNEARKKWKGSVKSFKKWLVEKWLIPNWRWHWWQIDDKIRALKSQLEQQEKNANKFKITWQEIKERTRQQLAELQLTLTSSQIKKAEQEEWNNDENIAMLNGLNFMLEQDDSFFDELAENETKNTIKSIKYCWINWVVRWNLAPYLIRRWWWINSNDEIAKIYNDSVWAWWFFDFSDEWSERVWPILKEIIVEVVVTVVSILLCWNGAWEAIYVAFRTAKALTKWLKWIQKLWKFFKVFNTSLFRTWGKQFVWKFAIKGAKWARTVTQVSHIATSTEKWIKLTQKVKNTIQIIKKTETLGSLTKKLAMKWVSLMIEWTTFHINSTLIHNAINWEDLGEWLNPRWYTEWPDWEKIPNWQSYAQSIAFLGILKATWKIIGEVNGRIAELVTKDSYTPSMVNKIFTRSLWLGWEMWWMMLTDQILSIAFDQSLKPITWEELISMFWMIVWLRLNWRFQMKIKEHAWWKITLRMNQEWTWNKFNVRLDGEWNILKVEWIDKNWKKIPNPEKVCWLKAGENWMNMRDIPNAMWEKTWTIEWWSRAKKNLDNLNTWDEITIKQWKNNIKLKKTADWKREVTDPGWNTAYDKWTKFEIEQNPNDKSYHLKNTEWKWTLSLDWEYVNWKQHKKWENWRIDVKLKSRFWNEKIEINESWRWQKKAELKQLREEKEKSKKDIEDGKRRLNETQNEIKLKEKENQTLEKEAEELNKKKQELEEKQKSLNDVEKTLEKKESDLQKEKEEDKFNLNKLERKALEKLKWNKIYIDWVKYSCSHTKENTDWTTQLTLTRQWDKFFAWEEKSWIQAPPEFSITSYRQLETVGIKKWTWEKRKVSAPPERNDVYEKWNRSDRNKTQEILDELFNPSEWSLWREIQKAQEKLGKTKEKRKINTQEIIDNKNDIEKTKNELNKVNENLLNNQSEQIKNETDIRKLREKENQIKSEIETSRKNIKDIDADLLKAETEELEMQLEEMENSETIEIDWKEIKVTNDLKESTKKQIELNKEKLWINWKKTLETKEQTKKETKEKFEKPKKWDKEKSKSIEDNIKEMEIRTENIRYKVEEKAKKVAELQDEITNEWKKATPEMKETLDKAIKELEIEKAKYELSKAETEYEKTKKKINEEKFKLWEEATEWDWSPLWDWIINWLEKELKTKEQTLKEAQDNYNKITNWKKEKTKSAEEKIKEMEIKTENIRFKVKEKEKRVAELQDEVTNEWKNASPEMKEALDKAIKELEIEKAKYELSKAETEYEKTNKKVNEEKFKLWEEATEWDWSPLWDWILDRLENELITKRQAVNKAKEKYDKLTKWNKEKTQENKSTQEKEFENETKWNKEKTDEIKTTPENEIKILKEKISKIEQEQAELKKQTKELEKELKNLKKNKKVKINWQEIEVTQDIIDATERQIKNNKEKITKNEKALKENKEKINEQKIKIEESKWWLVNIEPNGTISILKSDFSMEKILPDGTECKWDFDINWNLVSGLKIHPDWSREYWVYEWWKLSMWCHEMKLPEWWYKQTYITLNWTFEVKLDRNRNMIWAAEKVWDWYRPASPEVIGWVKIRFKKFQEDLKEKQEQRRKNREQRAKEREEARAKQLTYEEKKILKDIIKDVQKLPEGISKEYDLWNWDKIEIKKIKLWDEEYYKVFKKRILDNNGRIETEDLSWKLKDKRELEAFLKGKIIESRDNRQIGNNQTLKPEVQNPINNENINQLTNEENEIINNIVEQVPTLPNYWEKNYKIWNWIEIDIRKEEINWKDEYSIKLDNNWNLEITRFKWKDAKKNLEIYLKKKIIESKNNKQRNQRQQMQKNEQDKIQREEKWKDKQENTEQRTTSNNEAETNEKTLQEKLDLMCEWDVTVDNCKLTEEEINQAYDTFWKIKEITWKEKLTKLELQQIKHDKIWLKDLDHVQNMRKKILEIKDSNTIDLFDIWVFKEISEQQLDYFISLKWKINQLIWKINSTDLYNLNKISKWDLANLLDNIIINKGKIDKLTWNKTLDWSDIHELSEIENLSENLDIIIANKKKIKQFTWIRRNKFWIMDIKRLAGITERWINNALNIRSKISILTEENTFSLEDINNLTDIDENTLNRLILLKEKYWYWKVLNVGSFKLLKNLSENEFKKIQEITERDPRNIIDMCSLEWYKKLEIINNKIFKLTKEKWVDYAIVNKYGSIRLEYVWDKTYIFHAWMRDRTWTVNIQQIAWKALFEFANLIPDWYKITETLSLSWDSFPLFLREYQKDFRTDYTVRATWKFVYLNSQWENTPLSKMIEDKCVVKDAPIFEAATQADAQEVANKINELILKDIWQPLVEWQWINQLAKARVVKSNETWLRRVQIPQIEMVKEYNNGANLAKVLNKCKTYEEITDILLENYTTEYHFRDWTLTWEKILNIFDSYRAKRELPNDSEDNPLQYIPVEFIVPVKWINSEWKATWRKSNVHTILDS